MCSSPLQTRIENARREAGIDDAYYREVLYMKFRVSSVESLSDSQAWVLIRHLDGLIRYQRLHAWERLAKSRKA